MNQNMHNQLSSPKRLPKQLPKQLKVQCKLLDPRLGTSFSIPQYATTGSAGLDLLACIDSDLVLEPNTTQLISTGIAIYLADANYVAIVVPRSGLGMKYGVVLGNLVGVIDADYQGPIKVNLWNRSNQPYTIHPGDRIAQLLITPCLQADLQIVEQFSEATQRAQGGLGHSGI